MLTSKCLVISNIGTTQLYVRATNDPFSCVQLCVSFTLVMCKLLILVCAYPISCFAAEGYQRLQIAPVSVCFLLPPFIYIFVSDDFILLPMRTPLHFVLLVVFSFCGRLVLHAGGITQFLPLLLPSCEERTRKVLLLLTSYG